MKETVTIPTEKEKSFMCDYKDFQPADSNRIRENIEWSRFYAYNAPDLDSPRVLLIGDSICVNYHGGVRNALKDCANVAFWASSKCVTDPDYFRELDFYLDAYPYDMICFNNGLHCLTTQRDAWQTAYEAALSFIRAKLPHAKLSIVLCTAMGDQRNETVQQINSLTEQIAKTRSLPLVDLYTPTQALDKSANMRDAFHYTESAVQMQADIIAAHIRNILLLQDGALRQNSTETGPDGALA